MIGSQSAVPFDFDNETEEEEHVETHLNGVHADRGAGHAVGPGQQKTIKCLEAHLFAGGLSMDAYADIVHTASEAATLAVFRALGSAALQPHNAPAPCGLPGSDGNESETGAFQPFRRTFPRVVAAT